MRLFTCANINTKHRIIPSSFDCVLEDGTNIWLDTIGDVCYGEGLNSEIKGSLVLEEKELKNDEILELMKKVSKVTKLYVYTYDEGEVSDNVFTNAQLYVSVNGEEFMYENFEIEIV